LSILGTVPHVGIATDIFASARKRLEDLDDSRRGRHFEEGEEIPDYMQGWEEFEAKEDKVLVEMGEACEMLSRVMNTEQFTKEYEELYEAITALFIKYKG
jgi:allantoicase